MKLPSFFLRKKARTCRPCFAFFIQLWPRSFFRLWIFRGGDLWSAVLPLFWLCGRVPAFRAFARPFPGSQPGPSSLTASAASRRFSLRLGVVPAAGTGVIGSNGVLGGPGLTAASPKALVRNRVHWTHLFPYIHGVFALRGSCSVHGSSSFRLFFPAGESLICPWECPFPGAPFSPRQSALPCFRGTKPFLSFTA